MTNKEKYQRAFSTLHTSERIMEVKAMKETRETRKNYMPKVMAVCAAVILILGLASVAYAADIGGIKTSIQLWFQGYPVNATLEVSSDDITTYFVTFEDSDGETHEMSGGGIAYEPDGTQRSLTEEEIMADMDTPNLDFRDDGTVWVYCRSQVFEITDEFNEDGICYVQIEDNGETWYITALEDGSGTISNEEFLMP